jgi:nucleotide-binding universal stress UspA family protein
MFAKILYPTDFSDTSNKVIEYVAALKDAGLKKIIILHVIDKRQYDCFEFCSGFAGETPQQFEAEYKKAAMDKANQQLESISKKLTDMGLDVEVKVVTGIPFFEILKVEEAEDVSAIIIGSHGKSNVKEMMLGSVSEQVLRKSKKPVIVIKR